MSDTPIDPPLTPEEITECHRLADRHLALVRAALSGWPKPPRQAGARPGARQSGASKWSVTRPDRLMPTIAWRLACICRRGGCRRAGACRYGERPGDAPFAYHAGGGSFPEAPCFAALPKPVRLALPFAVMRRMLPGAFRDPQTLRHEGEAIRAAAAALRGGEDARCDQSTSRRMVAMPRLRPSSSKPADW
ncbi:hypothetical protein [Aurantimonas sp. VKM B-3413]|uniref:hypothetical protein n=1 Tax=Aurantimonas sp. VKM B-3413 TaxID=2779401 RepID=UPI001E47319B|nr:hypothetical protein [Aurantimonas sp. VKM B-3413]MCB8837910.1 hypothetical protein [Aurantimonas sp. VKM B-3413]